MDYKELRELQSLDLEHKLIITRGRIQEWYEYWEGNVYVSFSGGKDSTVLLHIVREMYPEVPAVFVDTGLEYPEIRQFVKTIDNAIWLKPKLNFKQVIEKYGYPVIGKEQAVFLHEIHHCRNKKGINYHKRINGNKWGKGKVADRWQFLINASFDISHMCCNVMKKNPFKIYEKQTHNHPFTGIMADESEARMTVYLRNGCNAFDSKRPISTPLGFWTEQDILQYLKENNPPYASCYGKICKRGGRLETTGVSRTGCMFCMFGCHMEQEPNRFQRMQVTHSKLYDYCIGGGEWKDGKWGPSKEGLGIGFVLDYIGVPYKNDNEGLWTTKELIEM